MQATVELPDGRAMTAQADGGSGHSGKRSHDIHFGLGATPPDRELPVELKWRDRSGVHSRRMKLKPGWHDARAIQPVMEAK
jgi:hypothetical protein